MKKYLLLAFFITVFSAWPAKAQSVDSMDVYLLTCEPGTESYTVYGHTALRTTVRGTKTDVVYNWGIFDFDTPNFLYSFARGKLDYLLGVYSYQSFLQEYRLEGRPVWSQKINLSAEEKRRLLVLLKDNLKPENIKYKYDFLFDNCATRVRDVLEKSLSEPVQYPEKTSDASFRILLDEFQHKLPWVDFGVDFLLGLKADRIATFREQMFLPMYLKENMSGAIVNHSGKNELLLGTAEQVMGIRGVKRDAARAWMPAVIVWFVLILVILVVFVSGLPVLGKISDWLFFTLFSLITVILFFCNFFSYHQALHHNMLLIAFNPLLPVIAFLIFSGRKCRKLCRLAVALAVLYFPIALIAGQGIHSVTVPLILILIIYLFKHSEFGKEDNRLQNKNIDSV